MLSCPFPGQVFLGRKCFQFYNDAAIPLFTDRHPAVLGVPAEAIWQESWPIIGPQFAAVMDRGERVYQQNVLIPILRYGKLERVYFTYSYGPIFEADGAVVGLAVNFQDTTGARERDIIAERFNQVLETTSDSIMTVDRDWIVTYMNPRAIAVSHPVVDVVGKNLWDCYPAFQFEGSPWVENYRRTMEQGIPTRFEAHYAEPINVWVDVQVEPSKDGITLFFADITQRKLREAERTRLFEDRQRFFVLVEEAQDFIAMCDLDGVPFYANPAAYALLGFRDIAQLNGTVNTYFFPEDQQMITDTFLPRVLRRGHAELEVRFRHQVTGLPIWMSSQVFLLRDAEGEPTGYATISRDLTAKRRTEEALIQTEKLAAVGRLASSIAHEINNPLDAAMNLLYLALNSGELPPEVTGFLEIAESELRRVSAISSQSLRFQEQSTSPVLCSVEDLLDSVLSNQKRRMTNNNIAVERRARSARLIACFDDDIRQVFNNLIANAVDAMNHRGGRLLVRTRRATDLVSHLQGMRITIADTAEGIAPHLLHEIFEPFFSTKGMAGTGLGLWVSREIVNRHSGTLRLRSSQRTGANGTVFVIFLPFEARLRSAAA